MDALTRARRRLRPVAALDPGAGRRALAQCSELDALAELEDDWKALDERRLARAPRQFGLRVQPQCPGCRKFVQSLARECPSCGFFGSAGYPG